MRFGGHICCVVVLAMAGGWSLAQIDDGPKASELLEQTAAAAKRIDAENAAQHGKDSEAFVRPGLLANRREKWVRIWARATALGSDAPVEFFLIPQDSGKDYEALAVAFAKPSDVHAALEFIGMKPGRPVNFPKNQFWPKGERVTMSFAWDQPGLNARPAEKKTVRAEQLVLDLRTKKPLPAEGFMFTGSYWITPEGTNKKLYAADQMDSKSIASDYNDPCTVLDLPRQASQGAVYDSQKPNPEFRFTRDQLILVTIEPEHKDGMLRVRDLTLKVSMPAGNGTAATARYELMDGEKRLTKNGTFVEMLGAFGAVTEAHQDPYVTVDVDGAMSLKSVIEVFGQLKAMDRDGGIRVEPPLDGQLYYGAFFPPHEWRDRTKRLGRPWELHLVEKNKQVAGTLILPADDIDDNDGKGDLKFTVGSAEEVARTLKEKSGRFSAVVLIYAPASMPYGHMLSFIREGMQTHPMMYVFLPEGK